MKQDKSPNQTIYKNPKILITVGEAKINPDFY